MFPLGIVDNDPERVEIHMQEEYGQALVKLVAEGVVRIYNPHHIAGFITASGVRIFNIYLEVQN